MTISSKPAVIGLAGTFASGKDTLAHYLVKNCGYAHFSTGDMVRKQAMQRFGSVERPICQRIAHELRIKNGAGFFVQKALHEYQLLAQGRGVVVTGLRTMGEAKVIQNVEGTIVFVDASANVRYERMKARKRDGEVLLSIDDFKDLEAKEWQAGSDDTDFNLRGIKETADIVLENNTTLETFIKHASKELFL